NCSVPHRYLHSFPTRRSSDLDLREKAIFWLGQRGSTENTEFLRTLYSRLNNQDLKEKILFSLSQQRGAGNEQWLMNVAVNSKEEDRKSTRLNSSHDQISYAVF